MPSREARKRYNYKMSKNTFNERTDEVLSNENTKILCLTHCKQRSKATAHKAFRNYIRRLNYRLKKCGEKNAKYIVVYERGKGSDGMAKHYLFINCPFSAMYLMQEWKEGNAFIVGADCCGGKLAENTKHKKRWIISSGLKKPQ